MSDPLRFYFDYLSSNAYLAFEALPALAARFERRIEPVPVVFAKLLEEYGQLGPAEVAPKLRWMARNNLRKAIRLGVPLHPPAFHPFNPLLALRVSSLTMDDESRQRLVGALFRAVFAEGRHVAEPDVVAEIASAVGLDGPACVEAAGETEIKERLRRQTADAIARGVFGVPTVITDGELFFGYDDFPFLEALLDGRDPVHGLGSGLAAGPQRPSAMRARHRERPALRLAAITLCARDPAALAGWYAETFALERCGDTVVGPGTRIVFEAASEAFRPGTQRAGFDVPSRDEVALWARRLGTALDDEPEGTATRVRDPEDNEIEIRHLSRWSAR